ncbi:phosphoribosylformylglycinamidine synthase-like [Uloborus diversus]|uniref:phosphoribosylformylglycinamidine synthase-like n=1 Tax=Uloborus diversus TaxID=327109 RepID=UPI0024092D31|nr:phosphoribosylformylglycinamidine synthase-like [Uloborus diversus]
MLRYYFSPALSQYKVEEKQNALNSKLNNVNITSISTEYCYYIETQQNLHDEELTKLRWILESFEGTLSDETNLFCSGTDKNFISEIGPRLNFSTPFSTNAVSICSSIHLPISRIERATRYLFEFDNVCDQESKSIITSSLHDKMTECVYENPIGSFKLEFTPMNWKEIDILGRGRAALEEINVNMGLAMDDWDLDFYTKMFTEELKKNPTTVECFDLAQSNSEHSRHWFFKGDLIIDGIKIRENLFQMIMKTQDNSHHNNVIKFSDNSSAIEGFKVPVFLPKDSDQPSSFKTKSDVRHIIFTAETHNFPTGVAPFSGAATGTGGRIRDVQAAGRGSHVIAGTAAYSFGNLNIPGYDLPWEDKSFIYPSNFALPVQVAVEASNGASDYGNKFGEPIISGFARSFGMKLKRKDKKGVEICERREYIKPIMFTGGIGSIDGKQIKKKDPEKGMLVVKIGGPVYRIGVGGGAASSIHVQGDQKEELDFGAVQRGDPEMEQKLNRVVRACVEHAKQNIICSIHDQGAGGNGNVLKEIVEGAGAVIYAEEFQLGDPTINVLELWGAEYQESNAILVNRKDKSILEGIGMREKCPISFVGEVTGTGDIVLVEDRNTQAARNPVDLKLSCVLGSVPPKTFTLQRQQFSLQSLELPTDLTLQQALNRVLRLPSVASKRYLTNKVDRSVTGLIAQQQCVGPLHTPLADVAVISLSYFDTVGSATAIGEQPIKGLLNPAAGARMSVAEALTNIVFAKISSLKDIKCSGNWMWAAKLPGEGAALYDACKAMCSVMSKIGIAIDGGKDSLSMAARVENETVKAPGTLVISAYAPCTDVRITATPDLKCPNKKGALIHVDLSNGNSRLGGTALAQCFNQLGAETPDLESATALSDAFNLIQELISKNKITAGHDISDGGFIVCLLEMAFAGNCGLDVKINSSKSLFETMFNEELGWILEVREDDVSDICKAFEKIDDVNCVHIGYSLAHGKDTQIRMMHNDEIVLEQSTTTLRDIWEETSFQLEMRQTNNNCVVQERCSLARRNQPQFHVSFNVSTLSLHTGPRINRVAIIREEGINGDREMIASFFMAGFEVWDITMTDLLTNKVQVSKFQGIVFPGGFSYADVLGSARGWAGSFLFQSDLKKQFDEFRDRSDTFSLGVCNGCQLMALLGWVAPYSDEKGNKSQGVSLVPNISERFESRFVSVKILKSPSIMLSDMENSVLGVWVAHGEGRFKFKNTDHLMDIKSKNLNPLIYVDDCGEPTMEYPMNPNGSVYSIAALCSNDGRHLAMMPHPERCVLPWQWPWMPAEWEGMKSMPASPWLKMFKNAFDWCCKNRT